MAIYFTKSIEFLNSVDGKRRNAAVLNRSSAAVHSALFLPPCQTNVPNNHSKNNSHFPNSIP
eukprot:m.261147 g.261147  ORF g.261147 m.261147 type:complete len:62 (-) comp19689_c0_seq3:44-229(-)